MDFFNIPLGIDDLGGGGGGGSPKSAAAILFCLTKSETEAAVGLFLRVRVSVNPLKVGGGCVPCCCSVPMIALLTAMSF